MCYSLYMENIETPEQVKKTQIKELYEQAKKFLKVELAKQDLNYIELSEIMTKKGYDINPDEIRTKIFRGSYSFGFLLAVADSLGFEVRLVKKNSSD